MNASFRWQDFNHFCSTTCVFQKVSSPPGGGHFTSGVQNVNLGLSRVRTRAILNRHEATLYGGGHALYNAVQTEFPFYAFFVAVHGVQGNFQGRCNL